MIGFALLGLFCWAVIAGYLWSVNSRRFRLVSGRLPHQARMAWRLPPAGEQSDENPH